RAACLLRPSTPPICGDDVWKPSGATKRETLRRSTQTVQCPRDGVSWRRMTDRVSALLARLSPILGPPDGAAEVLGGGITNHNYRVRLGGGDYVVRVTAPESALLGIDRATEHAASLAAAALGVGPEVAAFLADGGCLVTRFIPGRPVPPEEL